MADVGVDRLGALGEQGIGGIHQRAAGVDDVVDQDAGVAGDFADYVHHFGFAGALAALVDDGEGRVDALGEAAGAHHAADVGRYHHHVFEFEFLFDVADHHRRRIEIVGRDIEEALDLAGMQVERHDAVGAGAGDQVGDELGRDWRAGARFAVLPGVTEIRHHRGDAACRRTAQRVDDDQQFHQVVVGRVGRRLQDENVRATHVFLDFDENLEVGEALYDRLGQADLEVFGNLLRQHRVGIAGDELDRPVLRHSKILALRRHVGTIALFLAARRRGHNKAYRARQYARELLSRSFFDQDERQFSGNQGGGAAHPGYSASAIALMWRP